MDQLAAIRALCGWQSRAISRARAPAQHAETQRERAGPDVKNSICAPALLNRTRAPRHRQADGAAYYERSRAHPHRHGGTRRQHSAGASASPKGRLRVDVSRVDRDAVHQPVESLDFHARYPDIQLDVGTTDRPVDLTAESIDCVIRAGGYFRPVPQLVARRLGEMQFITCASPRRTFSATASRDIRATSRRHTGHRSLIPLHPHIALHHHDGERVELRGRCVRHRQREQRLHGGRARRPRRHDGADLHGRAASGKRGAARAPRLDPDPMPLYIGYLRTAISVTSCVFVEWVVEQFESCAAQP